MLCQIALYCRTYRAQQQYSPRQNLTQLAIVCVYIITHTYTEIMAAHDPMRYMASRWCVSETMHLACAFSTTKKAAERVVDLGVITAPFLYAAALSVVYNKSKKK